jgi:hypothetical protein
MTRRFSPQELTFLRNKIPIGRVVERLLGDQVSFACPVCGGTDTSINAAHNLARCFVCQRNFNPIEFVMHQLRIGFVDSVNWLKSRMPEVQPRNGLNAASHTPRPTAIADILADVVPRLSDMTPAEPAHHGIAQRLCNLEQSLNQLHRIIDELRSSLHQ